MFLFQEKMKKALNVDRCHTGNYSVNKAFLSKATFRKVKIKKCYCATLSPDWLIKKQTSSLKTGVIRSRKSLASSTMTGSSVSSSSTWRVWEKKQQHHFVKACQLCTEHRVWQDTKLIPQHRCHISSWIQFDYFYDGTLHQ